MPGLKLVIFEASLELVPRELWEHPSVYKSAWKRGKPPGEVLLDSSLHHQAIREKRLPEAEKRGRPDVVHFMMLEALSSPLNQHGLIQLYVHTIGDYVITVDPSTRLPRNYNRFVGLMEQLFKEGRVPPNAPKPLMTIQPMTLRSLIKMLGCKHVVMVTFDEGEAIRLRDLARLVAEHLDDTVLLLPGFPHGSPRRDSLEVATKLYKPATRFRLEPWTLISHVLALLSDTLNLI